MEEVNVRYGVINEKNRVDYEKQWQVQMGYSFITYDLEKAIGNCRRKGKGWIVEKISNIPGNAINYKTTVFRGGNGKD